MKIISKILNKISLSVIAGNKNSTPRIQSYIILLPILIMSLTFLFIEIWNFAYITYFGAGNYKISTEIIVVFGMLLSHHLALIFSRKSTANIEAPTYNDITDDINKLSSSKPSLITEIKKSSDVNTSPDIIDEPIES